MTTRRKFGWGLGAVAVLALFGSYIDEDSRSDRSVTQAATPSARTTTAAHVPVSQRPEWRGSVLEYDVAAGSGPGLFIDVDGQRTRVDLSHVGAVSCGGYAALESNRAAVLGRLAELAPIGSGVRVVRSTSSAGGSLPPGGYVYLSASEAGPSEETATAPASTTTSTSTVPTTTRMSSMTPTTTPATTTLAAAQSSTDSDVILNEILLAEGFGTLDMPDINLSALAPIPLDQQLASAEKSNATATNAARWTRLLTAYRHAWGTRSGLQALCRDDDDTAIVKEGQKAELDRLRAGPDGRLYTSDDDHSMYKFDENGNIYVEAPAYTSSGGGGGGGGFCRRSRWC
ncbi:MULTISPECIES: hypothetical protein [unclassified Rhodococcus (in: high G+C Gram-positive bacteria)]|uniref:hypothetical protein n=1 Tax=unclassified Rhodococcus (in: high G+C Gram-positive bacteria) TaxID=192944 RepID=UPI00036ACCF1|nr:hypothetical protein [Rhodococcus sp. DK17]